MAIPKEVAALADRLEELQLDGETAYIVMLQMRKPARATALMDYLNKNPSASTLEIEEKAAEITRTVDPTRHKMGGKR